jgi:hypothetical protein
VHRPLKAEEGVRLLRGGEPVLLLRLRRAVRRIVMKLAMKAAT